MEEKSMLKKLKKLPALQAAVLFLTVAFVIVLGACQGDGPDFVEPGDEPAKNYVSGPDALSWGITEKADVLTLGLMPGNDTSEIKLNWYSTGTPFGKDTKVRFIRGTFTAGTELIEETAASLDDAGTGNISHKATVNGLRPGANYQYAVSSDGENWSEIYDFKVPAAGAFKFAVVTDFHLAGANIDSESRYPATGTETAASWLETMNVITGKGVNFIASAGDQVDTAVNGNETEYSYFFAPPGLRNIPFAPVAGNHDRHLNFNHHYNLPNIQTFADETTNIEKKRNYFYLYNNVLFVVLNTAPGSSSGGTISSKAVAAQYVARYEQTLINAKTANAGKYDWLIVQHHKSTTSVGAHCADFDIQRYVEAGFEKLMSDQGVDFVLAGHDHVYSRTYPLDGRADGKPSIPDKSNGESKTYTKPGKPIYLTLSTSSGLKYYPVIADPQFVYPVNDSNSSLFQRTNAAYPYLGEVQGDDSTYKGGAAYLQGNLPASNAVYVQPFIPSYTIAEVNGKTIKFSTYAIASKTGTSPGASAAYNFNADTPYDWVQVTKE